MLVVTPLVFLQKQLPRVSNSEQKGRALCITEEAV